MITTNHPRLNVASILVEEEQLTSRFHSEWIPVEEAAKLALQVIKNKYSQTEY